MGAPFFLVEQYRFRPGSLKDKWAGLAREGYLGVVGAFLTWESGDWANQNL